jgi:hypothetical protein
LTLPDAPINLVDVVAITNKDQIGLDWDNGDTMSGGTIAIDYRVSMATGLGSDTYVTIVENLVDTAYTMTSVTTGIWYVFKVQTRNAEGYGAYSSTVTILAAQEPDQPNAPSTVWTKDFVTVVFTEPTINGAAILSYTIYLR